MGYPFLKLLYLSSNFFCKHNLFKVRRKRFLFLKSFKESLDPPNLLQRKQLTTVPLKHQDAGHPPCIEGREQLAAQHFIVAGQAAVQPHNKLQWR